MYEPTWSQPLENYQQQGSFVEPATPPATPPDGGVLVQLPCVSSDWLQVILGSLDQLRNPSSWPDSLTDAQRYDVLAASDRLRQMIAMGINVPCCNVELRLEIGCVLQYRTSSDGPWVDVTDWAANFAECVRQAGIPTPPLLPPGSSTNQRACNIAGYLATQVIKEALTQAVNAYNDNLTLLVFAGNLAAVTFAFDLPWTAAFIYAAYDIYVAVNAGTIADFNAALADGTLWSEITCEIYTAIKADGAVTRANYAAVLGAVCGTVYAHPDVITAICTYLTDLGVDGLLSLQAAGALDSVDCSGCGGSWCYEWDFTATDGGWVVKPDEPYGEWCITAGWEAQPHAGVSYLAIERSFSPTTITSITVQGNTSNTNGSSPRALYYYDGAGSHLVGTFFGAAGPIDITFALGHPGVTRILIYFNSDDPTTLTDITTVIFHGTGPNPFGASNCV